MPSDRVLEPIIEIVITADDEDWLLTFTKALIDQRLAAAAHHTSIRSVYTWAGQLHNRSEVRAAIHTRASLFDEIATIAVDRHSYEVACVIALPILDSTSSYQGWVVESTTGQR